jgi:hypothetical protein
MYIHRGSIKNAAIVDKKDMVMERATSPFDQYVKMLEVVPRSVGL